MLRTYSPGVSRGAYGVHPVVVGMDVWFKGWWFDGRVVWWSATLSCVREAEARAEAMARSSGTT